MAAPQPLHIFQKDVRHLWPETLVSLLLFVAFAWATPYSWQASEYSPYASILGVLLHVLMPVSWLIIISRLIHDESLVGDRQFWTSRPYHWFSLFLAKILYLVVFLYLPFFLMQVYLLRHAGLYPTNVMGGLFHNLLLLTVILVVPITALAAVTSTFPRLLLTTLGAIIYVLVAGGIFGYLVLRSMPAPHILGIIETLVIILPLAAVLIQYSSRKTAVSRGLLVATPLLVILVLAIMPANALIRSTYKVPTAADAPKLAPIPNPVPAGQTPVGAPRIFRGDVILNLPFSVAGVDKDSNYNVEGMNATITAPGFTWTSGYKLALGTSFNGGQPYTVLRVQMPIATFNRIHTQTVDVHLSLATEHLKASPAATWKATLLPFSVPDNGQCRYPATTEDNPDAASSSPTCRFPFKTPDLLFLTANVSPNSCAAPAGQPIPSRQVISGNASTLSFDPLVQVPINMQTGDPNPQHHYQLCPGTTLSFLEANPVGKARFELDQKQVTLDPYAIRVTPTPAGQPVPPTHPRNKKKTLHH